MARFFRPIEGKENLGEYDNFQMATRLLAVVQAFYRRVGLAIASNSHHLLGIMMLICSRRYNNCHCRRAQFLVHRMWYKEKGEEGGWPTMKVVEE